MKNKMILFFIIGIILCLSGCTSSSRSSSSDIEIGEPNIQYKLETK